MKYYTSTTEFNCGIDLHARQMYVCVMDRQGKKLVHTNINSELYDLDIRPRDKSANNWGSPALRKNSPQGSRRFILVESLWVNCAGFWTAPRHRSGSWKTG